uniref:Uncharacterized protein n=1 Tax=Lactuca sativa TaxID=4236 RepID=A0A9R1UZJ5_LACSA|nr:hypothetical protein LSAT_V11C700385360 [Lactuca sativa]
MDIPESEYKIPESTNPETECKILEMGVDEGVVEGEDENKNTNSELEYKIPVLVTSVDEGGVEYKNTNPESEYKIPETSKDENKNTNSELEYKEPDKAAPVEEPKFNQITGSGRRLDEKPLKYQPPPISASSSTTKDKQVAVSGVLPPSMGSSSRSSSRRSQGKLVFGSNANRSAEPKKTKGSCKRD